MKEYENQISFFTYFYLIFEKKKETLGLLNNRRN